MFHTQYDENFCVSLPRVSSVIHKNPRKYAHSQMTYSINARMLSCSAFFVLNGDGNGDGRDGTTRYYSAKNRSFDRRLGYESTRLPISDFDNFSPHFYRMRSSSCRTRATGRTYETSPSLAQTSIKECEILRQMKKLFCIHK